MPVGTVYEAFCASAGRNAHRDFLCVLPETALRYGIAAGSYTYAQAAREVEGLKNRYRQANFGPGHRAGLMLENRPDFFLHWLALNGLGVSVVPINADWRSAELEYLLQHSELCLAIVPEARARDLVQVAANGARPVVVAAPDLSNLGNAPSPPPLLSQTTGIDTECALLYTSGTTGLPKGCVLSNEYFLRAGAWYARIGGLCEIRAGTDRLITPLPMTHMNAMAYSTMVMVLTGGCIIPLDRFHPKSWWDSVRASRATIVHYLGVMPAMLMQAPPSSRDGDHQVRFGFGAGVNPRLHAAFEERFKFPLMEAWAMTETGSGAVIVANREPRKVGSACFGRAESSVDYRVVDDRGADLPAGQPGELLVRCAGATPRSGFFREYLKDPAATDEAWKGGYFRTGDMVWVDTDGDFHFIDRKQNVIRRSGENISAVEVEGLLLQHPRIASVGVAAVPDEVRGDEVMACVVPREPVAVADHAFVAHDIVAYCRERLAYFKAPGYVAFCNSLPLTSTEKIQRGRLKELARSLLGGPTCIDTRAAKRRTEAT